MSCLQTITTNPDCLFLTFLDNCKEERLYPPLRLYEDKDFVFINGADSKKISISKNEFKVKLDGVEYAKVDLFIAAALVQLKCIRESCCSGSGGTTVKSKLEKLKTEADDLLQVISYLDPGVPADRRVNTIVYSSAALGISATETFTYAGGPGDYYVTQIQLS